MLGFVCKLRGRHWWRVEHNSDHMVCRVCGRRYSKLEAMQMFNAFRHLCSVEYDERMAESMYKTSGIVKVFRDNPDTDD